MEKENHRYQEQDVNHVADLDVAVTMFEQLSDLPPKQKDEVIYLYRYDTDGRQIDRVKVTKTFRKVLHGFIQGSASELTRDGFGKCVKQVFDKHCAEREASGER